MREIVPTSFGVPNDTPRPGYSYTRSTYKKIISHFTTLTGLKFSDPEKELYGDNLAGEAPSSVTDSRSKEKLQFTGKTCTIFSFRFFLILSPFY